MADQINEYGANISPRSVRRLLNTEGLNARRPRKKRKITSTMAKKRLEWAKGLDHWTTEYLEKDVRLVIDLCKSRSSDLVDRDWSLADSYHCLASSPLPLFNVQLNLDTPLQLGGVHSHNFRPSEYRWTSTPRFKGFDGCIRNVLYNGEVSW
ncbi:beta-catenin binding [Homalodisca vitripennis]|nr:beta-catenin binding [Homalodisca vitripennis]